MTGAPPGNTGCRSIAGRQPGDTQGQVRTSHGPRHPGPGAHEPWTETGVLSGQSPGAALAQGSSPRRPSWGRRRTCPGSEGRRGGFEARGESTSKHRQHTPGAPADAEFGAPATADLRGEYESPLSDLASLGIVSFWSGVGGITSS